MAFLLVPRYEQHYSMLNVNYDCNTARGCHRSDLGRKLWRSGVCVQTIYSALFAVQPNFQVIMMKSNYFQYRVLSKYILKQRKNLNKVTQKYLVQLKPEIHLSLVPCRFANPCQRLFVDMTLLISNSLPQTS